MKRFTLILSLLVAMVTTAMAQTTYEQKIPHALYKVTALSEASVSGNEGGVAFLEDNDPMTFYHSNWSASYEDGTNGKKKGEDGLQAFMVELPMEQADITKITYAGRSDGSTNGWAKKVRIYAYTTLPEGLTTNLSSLSYADKEDKLGKESSILGTPVFNNNDESVWATDLNVKTATFATPQNAKYILFVMDESSNGWLTCADFNIYYNMTLDDGATVTEVEHDKPYYLKITNGAYAEKYVDITTPLEDTSGATIGCGDNPVAVYFKSVRGSWHISTMPVSEYANDNTFLGISKWCATPNSTSPANYTVDYNTDGTLTLLQNTYYGDNNKAKCYLGGNAVINGDSKKIFTDNIKDHAIKIQLVPLTDIEAAKHKAGLLLARTGAGYPAEDSEARTALQAAIDATDATVETIETALTTYKAVKDVVAPEAGKVYRIVSALPGFATNLVKKAIYSNVDNANLSWNTLDNADYSYMWVVLASNNDSKTITIMNLNDARYPQHSVFSTAVKPFNTPCESAFEPLGGGQFQIKANELQGMHANNHANGSGNGSNIINYNTGADGASAWYIQEVPVTEAMFDKLIAVVEPAYAISALVVESEGKTALKTAIDNARNSSEYATAFASVTTALANANTTFVDQVYLYMKSKKGLKYAYVDGDNSKLLLNAEKSAKSIFKFTRNSSGTYNIQVDNGYYAQGVGQSTQVIVGASAVEYTVRSLDNGYYVMRPASSTNYREYLHDSSNGNVVGWDTSGDNTHWAFELLDENELANIYDVEINVIPDITPTITYHGESYIGNATVKQTGGFYHLETPPVESDITINGVDESVPYKAAIKSNNISLIAGYPADNMYVLRCNKGNSYARYHSGSTLSANDNTNMLTYEAACRYESLFYIEEGTGDYTGYYTIRPVAASDKYVYSLGTADEDSKVATGEKPANGLTSEYYWKITSFGSNAGNITPYDDRVTTSTDGAGNKTEAAGEFGWNKRGSYNGYGHIGYWKGGNATEDNLWTVLTVEEAFPLPEYTEDDSTIGLATYASVEASVMALKYMTPANLNVIASARYTDVVAPNKGGYFRLKNAASNNYMSGNANNITLLADGAEAKSTVFYLDENNALLSYNSGRYLSCYDKGYTGIGAIPADGKFNFAYGGATANTITYYNNSGTGAWTYGNGTDGGGLDRGTSMPNQTGYNWLVQTVESLPVTITAAKYATFFAPVEVTVPEGVEAYYVTADGVNSTYITLTKIENGVVPANTGVILYAEAAGAYDLNITTTGAAAIEDNLLRGTAAATYVTDDAYVLAKDGNNEAYLGKATKNQSNSTAFLNNSHKAYLVLPATASEAASYSFRFGEGTTGIDQITDNRVQSTAIYDLTGRRVENIAAPGIYIVNGKKVLVK